MRRFIVLVIASAAACSHHEPQRPAPPPPKFEALFVQSAPEIEYDGYRLRLKQAIPMTLFFSDRPVRVAGNMSNQDFLYMWGQGTNSYVAASPKASLSFIEDQGPRNIAVVLTNPRLEGTDVVYDAQHVEGTIPTAKLAGSLFIDISDLPVTPIAYAGAAQRRVARAMYY